MTENVKDTGCCSCAPAASVHHPERRHDKRALKVALAITVVAALGSALGTLDVQQHLLDLVSWIRGAGWSGVIVFALAYVVATVLFLPGSILTLGAGFAYGVVFGTAVVWMGANLQTTNRRIYAAGDVASRYQFTHVADVLARIVLQNALFLGRKKVSALKVPWCTYTSPEVAHVGLYEHEAVARGLAVDTVTTPMHEVDRAVLDGEEEGFLRVHLAKGTDRILGATLVASRAGDMISELTVAMAAGRGLGTIAGAIHPYPTQAEVMKKAADAYNRTRLTPRLRRLFERWLALRR